ncbi:hypothetical protein V8D89_012100 [Ganoderma adspersum]
MMAALGHNFVLRHNTHIKSVLKPPSKFTRSTFGSHHIRLVADCARRWNKLLECKDKVTPGMEPLPILNVPSSEETFGMVKMGHETAAHQSFASIKKEPVEDDLGLLDLFSQDLLDASRILSQLGIDLSLLYQLPQTSIQAMTLAVEAEFSAHLCTATHNSACSHPALAPPRAPQLPPILPHWPPADIVDVDTLSDPNSREQKAGTMEASRYSVDPEPESRDGGGGGDEVVTRQRDGVDRKGKGVDRSTVTPTRNRRAQESSDSTGRAHAPIEIPSDDESLSPSQPKPPTRKKLHLYVPGTPAPAKSKGAASTRSGCATSVAHTTAPLASASSQGTLHSFFSSPSQASSSAAAVPILGTVHFPRLVISSLTPSQHMFSVASGGIDPHSLSLSSTDYDEFRLLLLRAEGKWATYTMSPYDWVCAASAYNKELERLNQNTQKFRPLKTPRALMENCSNLN